MLEKNGWKASTKQWHSLIGKIKRLQKKGEEESPLKLMSLIYWYTRGCRTKRFYMQMEEVIEDARVTRNAKR